MATGRLKPRKGIDIVPAYQLTPTPIIDEISKPKEFEGKFQIIVQFPRRLELFENRKKFAKCFDDFEKPYGEIMEDIYIDTFKIEPDDEFENRQVTMEVSFEDSADFLGELTGAPTVEEVIEAGGEIVHPYLVATPHWRDERMEVKKFKLIGKKIFQTWERFLLIHDEWHYKWADYPMSKTDLSVEATVGSVMLLKEFFEVYKANWPYNRKVLLSSNCSGGY